MAPFAFLPKVVVFPSHWHCTWHGCNVLQLFRYCTVKQGLVYTCSAHSCS